MKRIRKGKKTLGAFPHHSLSINHSWATLPWLPHRRRRCIGGLFWLIKDALSLTDWLSRVKHCPIYLHKILSLLTTPKQSDWWKKSRRGGKKSSHARKPILTLLPFDNWTNGSSFDEEASSERIASSLYFRENTGRQIKEWTVLHL